MEKAEIIQQIKEKYSEYISHIETLDEVKLCSAEHEKWSAIQQTEHLYKSVQPLATGLFLPTFILHLIFGKSNRKSITYEEIVIKYQNKLKEGAKSTRAYIPGHSLNKEKVIQSLNKSVKDVCERLNQYSENQLDSILLPHPIIGKITLREMMYFTIYHVQHHLKSLQS